MWTVSYNEYLNFSGVKEGIKEVKKAAKKQKGQFGYQLESDIMTILSQHNDLDVKKTSPQMDVGFGADALVSYLEGGKNYSFYLDITMKAKDQINYFTASGSTTTNINEAFTYETECFKLKFGIKEKHGCHFFYDKPVVVAYVEDYISCTEIPATHLNNIKSLLISLNQMLFDMGYGARASKKIRPNLKRFRNYYKQSVEGGK